MKPEKVTFRSDWLNLISTLSVQEQQRLCYAVLLRLFGSAAEAIGVSTETLRKLCKDKKIPHIKMDREYRIKPKDINAYLESMYQKEA